MSPASGGSVSTQQKMDVLRQAAIFNVLGEDELRYIAERALTRNFAAGEIIFAEGDSCQGLYVIQSGLVKIFKSSAGGREQVLGMERAGSSVAELPVFDGGPYPASTSAVVDSTLLFINKNDFYQLCRQQPEVALKILRVVGARLRTLVGLIEELSFKTVRHRLAGVLVRLAERRGKRTSKGLIFTLSTSNQELASQIGTVRELVSRNLSELQSQNLIQIKGKTITVANLEALRGVAATEQ